LMASSSASATSSTLPSGRFLTQPETPRRRASRCVAALKKTPVTLPRMMTWTRFVDMAPRPDHVANPPHSSNSAAELATLPDKPGRIVVEGTGLHTGSRARVTLCRCPGPVRLSLGSVDARVDELCVADSERATTVEFPGARVRLATVEHMFAALAGLGIHDGVRVCVEGSELPLLDGGAAQWCEHLSCLDLRTAPPRLRIAREGVVHVGASRYEFAVAPSVEVQVRFETDDRRVSPEAHWLGDPSDFRARIAPARTFAFLADLGRLAERGLARGVDPASVILLAPDAVHCVAPYSPDEPARHKLLDLVGDSYLCGGPPLGRLRALRPGHCANVLAFRQALAEGILTRDWNQPHRRLGSPVS
jgi:UDP-3-O-[3-hydroxymyristoyl] N-acetylglucosamine deacetylase